MLPDPITLDFETLPIARRPHYPPSPVGLAVGIPGERPFYLGWGHDGGNNSTLNDAMEWLWKIWKSEHPLLFHNAKFDLAVAYERIGMPLLEPTRVHDTLFLAYLCDPHIRKLGLKPLAADLLAWAPEERNVLDDWIWSNKQTLEARYGAKYGTVKKSNLGAWIHAAPCELVAEYACGDVARTRALFRHLYPLVEGNSMLPAYRRELEVLPILMANEREGIRVDLELLERDIGEYSRCMETAETWLRAELRAGGLNFDADRDVAAVLQERGIVTDWKLTASGQLSTSKENLLPEHFTDPRIASAMGYRNRLKTCLEMFMRPWVEQARLTGGTVHTSWNQVRGEKGGTRTGRPSTSDPNFLNISKSYEGRTDAPAHPDFLGVVPLPICRRYLLPDHGGVWLHRDFSAQELRVFAHYEQGDLWRAYQENPGIDVHDWVRARVREFTGADLEHTRVKNVTFSRLYGGGLSAIQRQARCKDRNEAQRIANYHDKALPGRKTLNEEIARMVRRHEPIRTWGGRLYHVEPPEADGRDKIYKMINYLIQGSAADLTKQALIDWAAATTTGRFLVTVYDEINISAPAELAEIEMAILRDAMGHPRISVPMLSNGKWGMTWGDLVKCS